MDSFYIMRNLLMIFCHIGVFWTNLGNCEGGCDRYTQCHYNETRMHSTVSCNIEIAGNTAPPCYGDGSNISCSCNSENYQLSSPDNSYLCRPDRWEDGLYDLYCLRFCDKYTQCHYDETWVHSTVICTIETAGDTAPPCYGDRSIITCSCKNETYQLSSPNNSYLCRLGTWEDGLYDLYCLPSPCDEPAPPDDKVFHYPDFAEGEMYPNGIEIMYDCPDGWDLNGHMTAVCLYGIWTDEDAYCTVSPCDEPAPPDDKVFHSPDFAEGEMYPNGTEIMYDCPEGRDLNGTMTAVCLYGVWTYEDAFCTASPCDKPAPPDDWVPHNPDFAEGEMYPSGTKIIYYCSVQNFNKGHRPAVCLYGVWTYEVACLTDPVPILLVLSIAIYTLLFAVLLIWLVKKHCLRRGTKWIPSVEGVANEQNDPEEETV